MGAVVGGGEGGGVGRTGVGSGLPRQTHGRQVLLGCGPLGFKPDNRGGCKSALDFPYPPG